MKKVIIGVVSAVVLLVGVVLVVGMLDFNRMSKSHAYYQVEAPSDIEETKLDSGEIMKRYVYDGAAYKEDGIEVKVHFTAAKELREDAYLKLYLDKNQGVTSYDEVQESDIPKNVTL